MAPYDVLLAICPPLLWAVTYTLAKPAVMQFPPIFMMAMVYALTALLLYRPSRRFQTPWWALMVIAAFGGAIQSGMIFIGMTGLPASTAILIVQTQVPFAVLCGWALGRERLSMWRGVGVVISLGGVALIAGSPESAASLPSLLLVILGTLSWGIAQALIRLVGKDDGRATTAGISLLAAPQLFVASLLLEHGQMQAVDMARPIHWLGVVLLAAGGFGLAYSIWYGLLQRHRVDQIAPFVLLMPPFGVAFSLLLLGERPTFAAVLGCIIIVSGLAITLCVPSAKEATMTG